MEYISEIPNAPKAVGPYSPATIAGDLVFLSGQVPLDPELGKLVEGDIETQTRQVMKNLTAVLDHLGLSFNDVAKTTIFLTNPSDFPKVNAVYADAVGDARPARSTITVAALPLGAQIEIEMIAVRGR